MKQYLLIPIEKINSRIKELNKIGYDSNLYDGNGKITNENWNKSLIQQENLGSFKELEKLKSKGEIIEDVPQTYGKDYKLIKTIK